MAIKKRYLKQYDEKEEFVNAITNDIQAPTKEKALMRGAVERFNPMPPLIISDEKAEKIVAYLYDNDPEIPEWFSQHEKQRH